MAPVERDLVEKLALYQLAAWGDAFEDFRARARAALRVLTSRT